MAYRDVVLAEPTLLHYWRLGESGLTVPESGAVSLAVTSVSAPATGIVDGSADAVELVGAEGTTTTCTVQAVGLSGYRVFEAWVRNFNRLEGGGLPARSAYLSTNAASPTADFILSPGLASVSSSRRWALVPGFPGTTSTAAVPADDDPHHVVVATTASSIMLYVDGVKVVDASTAGWSGGFTVDPFQSLRLLGSRPLNWPRPRLTFDEIALYSALSESQIDAHYEMGYADPPHWGLLA